MFFSPFSLSEAPSRDSSVVSTEALTIIGEELLTMIHSVRVSDSSLASSISTWGLTICAVLVVVFLVFLRFIKAACKKVPQNRLFSLSYAIVMF